MAGTVLVSEPANLLCEELPQRQPKAKRKRAREEAAQQAPSAEEAQVGQPTAGGAEPSAPDAGRSLLAAAVEVPVPAAAPTRGCPQHAQLDLQEYRSAAEEGQQFEYLDHTADVQLHAWGGTLKEAFENVGLCMFNYMTPLEGIGVVEGGEGERRYEAEGHDLSSLLYRWLDELLFGFATDFFVPRSLQITAFDRERRGERFDRQRHVSGTEIKAITYSAMQINEREGDAEVFVIVDI